MVKYIIILLYLIIYISSKEINNNESIIPKELIHGKIQNASWEMGKFYEYYINISNYELNEENILEIYGINYEIYSSDILLYFSLVNVNDIELIKNGSIKPNIDKDIYPMVSQNQKFDFFLKESYLFIPFKKTSFSQNFLIILIENIYFDEFQTSVYIPKRIPTINIEQINSNNVEVCSKKIEVRDDIRLYYKIDIKKINLLRNNIYFYINQFENEEQILEVNYYTNLSSLQNSDFNFYIIQKNNSNISEIILGIKSKNNYNKEKYVNLSIRIDDNLFYHIYSKKRENKKIYVENLNCDKDLFIIEDYLQIGNSKSKYLILDKLYGNYSLNYLPITDLNFENYEINNETDIYDYIFELDGLLNVYILKCVTPSAFHFEIFSEEDTPEDLYLGQDIKTFFYESEYYYDYIYLNFYNDSHKYKVNVRIMDSNSTVNRSLFCLFRNQYINREVEIIEPDNECTEIYYANYFASYPYFRIGTFYDIFVEYFFTSNHLIQNIAEGRTKLDTFPSNTALKIRKDAFFDYISIEVRCEEDIKGLYELKLINSYENIEEELNTLMVGLPKIMMPVSHAFNLKISNPYDKFDQIADINNLDNNFYLLFTFNKTKPVYLNIEYIYTENIIDLPPIKSVIIIPQKEYEIYSYNENYEIQDKILFNINKCNNLVNYTFINYYENKNNIIKETQIKDSHQEILIDNIYYRSKILLNKESEEEKDNSTIYPAEYYNKGDILINYFLIESSILKELKFTSDFNIIYENGDSWNNIILSWKKYISRESKNFKIDIPTNYSIYILPKNSIVNTMCQLFLIPSNKSIINKTQIEIDLNEGQYKIAIIAIVIDSEIPFEIMYNILELNVIKETNTTLIILLSLLGAMILILILFMIFRKKILFALKRRRLSENIIENDINKNILQDNEEKEEKENLEKLIKIISKE